VNQPHVADDISDPDGYEIVLDARDLSDNLGASRSTRSVSFIRRDTCRAGDKLAVVNNEQPLLSSSEFRPFWISLKDHELRVGTGIVVGADEIMKAKDLPAFKQNTLYLGFLAFNLASAIRIVSIDSPLKPLPANQRVTLTNYVPDRLTDTEYFELSPLTGTSKPWQIPPTYTVPQCPWGSTAPHPNPATTCSSMVPSRVSNGGTTVRFAPRWPSSQALWLLACISVKILFVRTPSCRAIRRTISEKSSPPTFEVRFEP